MRPAHLHLRAAAITGLFAALTLWDVHGQAPARTQPRRVFPDTSARIGILSDQLPREMTPAQRRFAATHYVGTQKQTLDLSRAFRAINPNFIVLHYRLAMWQSAPNVVYITEGTRWGNDFPEVTKHEDWFWHNQNGQRVTSRIDAKLLMNLANPELRTYWIDSMLAQVRAGEYDAVFADSASPALLQWEANAPAEPRLSGARARETRFAELGGQTFIEAWEAFMSALDRALAAENVALIPNVGALVTSWDSTRYEITQGVFLEGFAQPGFTLGDWRDSTNRLLSLASLGKIIILQNYLRGVDDLERRRYYLANYLLVKGSRTYLDYFANGIFQWYPEWDLDLGRALTTGRTVDDYARDGVYRRDFERGIVLVNPTDTARTVVFASTMKRLEPVGGGDVGADGMPSGSIRTAMVDRVVVPARSAEILIR